MAQHEFAFLSAQTFARVPRTDSSERARFGLAGICWDGATTNRAGARMGPAAIRQASQMLCDATHPLFGVDLDGVVDVGDLALPNTALAAMRAALEPRIAELVRDRPMVWLGGDHSITLSILRVLRQHYGRPLAVLHFDAHCDTWTDHFGEPSGHGTWVYEAVVEGLIAADATVQIGIRSAAVREARDYITDHGGLVLSSRDLRGLESPTQLRDVLAGVVQVLTRHGAAAPVYLSFDIDCLDPAFAPGTGTPEPGGLTMAQTLTCIEELSVAPLNWVGMDCVEVAPPYDHAELTATAAASLVWTWLCGRLAADKRA